MCTEGSQSQHAPPSVLWLADNYEKGVGHDMSNYDAEDDDFDFEDTANDAMRQLRKANKAKERELSELKAEMEKLRSDQRDRVIKDVFTSRGVPAKLASFVPKDIELNEDSLSAWLEEYSDVFGIKPPTTEQPDVPSGYQDAYQRQQQTVNTALSADRERLVLAQMEEAAAKGPEALKAFFADMSQQGL